MGISKWAIEKVEKCIVEVRKSRWVWLNVCWSVFQVILLCRVFKDGAVGFLKILWALIIAERTGSVIAGRKVPVFRESIRASIEEEFD